MCCHPLLGPLSAKYDGLPRGQRSHIVCCSPLMVVCIQERKQNLASTEGDSALRRALLVRAAIALAPLLSLTLCAFRSLQQSREDFDNEGRNLEAAMLMSMNVTPTSGIGGVPADDATAAMQVCLLLWQMDGFVRETNMSDMACLLLDVCVCVLGRPGKSGRRSSEKSRR